MITIFQFANLALLDLLMSFRVKQEFVNSFNVLDGDYSDFTVYWYKIAGSTLCFTMLINAVSASLGEFPMLAWINIKRIRDRGGCCRPIRKFPQPKDEVNTKMVIQTDLEKLYTGPEIKPYNIYAQ